MISGSFKKGVARGAACHTYGLCSRRSLF